MRHRDFLPSCDIGTFFTATSLHCDIGIKPLLDQFVRWSHAHLTRPKPALSWLPMAQLLKTKLLMDPILTTGVATYLKKNLHQ